MFASRTDWRLEPNRLAQALETHRRSGKRLLDLAASNPTICEFEYSEQAVLAALANPRSLVYRPESKGLREARQAVASYYRTRMGFGIGDRAGDHVEDHIEDRSGVRVEDRSRVRGEDRAESPLTCVDAGPEKVDPEKIVLTSGTSEGYSHIFRLLCAPGDEVLVPVPGYPLFEFLADLADIRLVPYPLHYDHGWQIDFQALRSALTARSRAIIVVHPNNPTGSLVKQHEAAELTRICALADMALVVDEVFLDYPALGHPAIAAPATFAAHSGALTFTLSGISKIAALPQMKLAWVVVSGPPALADAAINRLEIVADTYLSPSTPVQLALAQFLDLRGSLQAQLQQRIADNQAHLDALLLNSTPLQRLAREAGWYAILRVPATIPDDDLAVDLLERCSVLVHPGQFFNFSQNGFLVLSLITPEAEFQEGVRRLCKFFADGSSPSGPR